LFSQREATQATSAALVRDERGFLDGDLLLPGQMGLEKLCSSMFNVTLMVLAVFGLLLLLGSRAFIKVFVEAFEWRWTADGDAKCPDLAVLKVSDPAGACDILVKGTHLVAEAASIAPGTLILLTGVSTSKLVLNFQYLLSYNLCTWWVSTGPVAVVLIRGRGFSMSNAPMARLFPSVISADYFTCTRSCRRSTNIWLKQLLVLPVAEYLEVAQLLSVLRISAKASFRHWPQWVTFRRDRTRFCWRCRQTTAMSC
jgi:hypothetical protein